HAQFPPDNCWPSLRMLLKYTSSVRQLRRARSATHTLALPAVPHHSQSCSTTSTIPTARCAVPCPKCAMSSTRVTPEIPTGRSPNLLKAGHSIHRYPLKFL